MILNNNKNILHHHHQSNVLTSFSWALISTKRNIWAIAYSLFSNDCIPSNEKYLFTILGTAGEMKSRITGAGSEPRGVMESGIGGRGPFWVNETMILQL